jgi:hypothetical protein
MSNEMPNTLKGVYRLFLDGWVVKRQGDRLFWLAPSGSRSVFNPDTFVSDEIVGRRLLV